MHRRGLAGTEVPGGRRRMSTDLSANAPFPSGATVCPCPAEETLLGPFQGHQNRPCWCLHLLKDFSLTF